MPLPLFPTETGVPGDGDLLAIYGGSPASTEVVGGLIHHAQVIESYPLAGLAIAATFGKKGEPLLYNGVTVWIQGSLLLNTRGEPTTSDFADMLSRWTTLRDKLLLTNFELFLYYHPSSPTTYRKYKTVNTAFLHSFWTNPVTLSYLVGLTTTDKTLYTTAPGA
jgi:hypothetical protein